MRRFIIVAVLVFVFGFCCVGRQTLAEEVEENVTYADGAEEWEKFEAKDKKDKGKHEEEGKEDEDYDKEDKSSGGKKVRLQDESPGTPQEGNINISGNAIIG